MIECVPNVSEGRRRAVIGRLVDVVRQAGAQVIDVHCDADHHRSVLTLVSDVRTIIEEGVVALVRQAAAWIDLREHSGIHPRMGAVDVVPFVPLRDASMDECVAIARRVGCRIGDELGIPVYLYGEAASASLRRNLALVRRGGFEGLSAKIERPEWRPDYGPTRVHPTAGAVAVGARELLVAYNVNLDTEELRVAREIAAAVRASNGGLPGVKALGFPLTSRRLVQVSMNLTDVRSTSVSQAFERVKEEARRRGVRVLESEIVGLVPRAALGGATAKELMIGRDLADDILEERLSRDGLRDR